MRHITSDDLPEDVARRAEAQVASGRFKNVEDVIRAGVEALDTREALAHEWLEYLRLEAAEGFAELDRGECVRGTPAALMKAINAEVDLLKE